jgi:DMSO/TMAO reductase YedYZ molybdopterin-dependent catalytic subunit
MHRSFPAPSAAEPARKPESAPTAPGLVTVTEHPFNAEAPLEALAELLTPTPLFYVRCNFAMPEIEPGSWRLVVDGEVEHSIELTLAELRALPQRSVTLTIECAGNGRLHMAPVPSGTAWNLGAVSTATFTGVPLRHLLERVRPAETAREVLFLGADGGDVETGQTVSFARSLPLAAARAPEVLLAWAMNDEPLPREHGAPLRLVVPGWYGMASVKWLVGIRLLAEPFHGHFQTERYIYVQERGTPDGTPVTRMRVRSLIASPADGAELGAAPVRVRGSAWSGHGGIRRVEVSTDGGATWAEAELGTPPSQHAATPWRLEWLPPGAGLYQLISRATDEAGNHQPLEQVWNAQGYGNNVVQRIEVRVRG